MHESDQAYQAVNYDLLAEQAEALLSGQRHRIANAANLSALIFQELQDVNWVGFYFVEDENLVLGPFQGKPACVHIPVGRGVCGAAASKNQNQRVSNVHDFDDHIVCDIASESELVIPLVKDSTVIGVLDLDSPVRGRFSKSDELGVSKLARIYENAID